jgi:hypothetical protein
MAQLFEVRPAGERVPASERISPHGATGGRLA